MKEKIKKIVKYPFKNWGKIAEIIVVLWAIVGMFKTINMTNEEMVSLSNSNFFYSLIKAGVNLPFVIVLVYFLSAILILYLLKKYEK
ncbi:MAG: hypothetical protein ACOCRX_09950 [Candidatus Woesearchaeota archaeon]